MPGVRLRALRDAPDPFGTTFEEDEARSSATWREHLAKTDAPTWLVTLEGDDVGMIHGAGYRGADGAAGLFGMWVAPDARGRGAGDRLVQVLVDWARAGGYDRILLDVGDDNSPAIRLYERHGFVPTGVTSTLPPLREHVTEHQRALSLGGEIGTRMPAAPATLDRPSASWVRRIGTP